MDMLADLHICMRRHRRRTGTVAAAASCASLLLFCFYALIDIYSST